MELYDENVEQKKSKAPVIIGVCIAILVIITIMVVVGILYLKSSITLLAIDGVKSNEIWNLIYIEENENNKEIYMPIIKAAEFFGYKGYVGDYKNRSEDKSKCYVTNGVETAMFTLNSDTLIKTSETSEYEYITLKEPVFEQNGELYTTINGIEKAFNVIFYIENDFKNINIFTMDYLNQYYMKKFGIEESKSIEFADKKAIFEDMLIIEENKKFGVINVQNKNAILEPKYEEISYLPSTTDFIVKSNGKYGIMTKEAESKVRTVYDEIKIIDTQKGLFLVKQNNAYGIINSKGTVVISPEYKQIGIDSTQYIQNGVDNGYILLDEIIPIKNSEGLWGFFNINGEKIVDFKYNNVGCESSEASNSYPAVVIPSHKVLIVKKDKYYKLLNIQGKELIDDNILNTIYLKTNSETGKIEFFMTYSNNTKTVNVEEYLLKIGE